MWCINTLAHALYIYHAPWYIHQKMCKTPLINLFHRLFSCFMHYCFNYCKVYKHLWSTSMLLVFVKLVYSDSILEFAYHLLLGNVSSTPICTRLVPSPESSFGCHFTFADQPRIPLAWIKVWYLGLNPELHRITRWYMAYIAEQACTFPDSPDQALVPFLGLGLVMRL